MSDYSEHLISMAGGDGERADLLDLFNSTVADILATVESTP